MLIFIFGLSVLSVFLIIAGVGFVFLVLSFLLGDLFEHFNADIDLSGGINRFAQTGPTLIFSLLQQLQALGINLPEIVSQLGVKGGNDQLTQPPALPKESSPRKKE